MNVSLEEFKAGLEKERKRREWVKKEVAYGIKDAVLKRRYRFIKKQGGRKVRRKNDVWQEENTRFRPLRL